MRVKIWVVSAANGERGERPCLPAVFGTSDEAEAHADRELRSEWEAWGPVDEVTGFKIEYPGDWRAAQAEVLAEVSDGSWGQYEITVHDVEVVDTHEPPYDEVLHLLDDVSAALRNTMIVPAYGGCIPAEDVRSRMALTTKARDLCDRLLRPEPEPEDERC